MEDLSPKDCSPLGVGKPAPDELAILRSQLDGEVARRTRAEQALLQREVEFADFVENAAEGLHQVDGHGCILWANRAELAMLGYSKDEYIGRHIAEFHVDRDVIESILKRLLAGETLYDEPARLRCKDGSVKHVLIHSNGCFEGDQLRYTRCFTRDATDRIARRKAEGQRDNVLMRAPVAAALLDGPDLVFQLVNQRFQQLVADRELLGQRLVDALPEVCTTGLPATLAEVLVSGRHGAQDEYRVLFADASDHLEERCLQISLEPLSLPGSDPAGVIMVVVDVTPQFQARTALERAAAEKAILVRDLEAASQAKDEFLAMLGHELRNPLAPIVTALQLMRKRSSNGSEREQAIIQRQVDHLVRLVDDLLDVAKVTRGKVDLKRERFDVSQALARAVEQASHLLEQRNHRLHIDVKPGVQWVGDPFRIAQVVANLLTNAARYTDAGGEIRLHAAVIGTNVLEISVADNGAGLSDQLKPHIFDLFFQGRRGIDRAEGGLGLGLALVKSLVSLHQGTVEAHSDGLGQGSTFVIRLPLSELEVPAADETSPRGRKKTQRPHQILIVDDNADAAESLGILLEHLGHTVHIAHDPVAALSSVGHFTPDVAILDIGLPVMDGYELAGRLRAELTEPCRFVALTGYGQAADMVRSRAAGFDLHCVKPVHLAELSAALD